MAASIYATCGLIYIHQKRNSRGTHNGTLRNAELGRPDVMTLESQLRTCCECRFRVTMGVWERNAGLGKGRSLLKSQQVRTEGGQVTSRDSLRSGNCPRHATLPSSHNPFESARYILLVCSFQFFICLTPLPFLLLKDLTEVVLFSLWNVPKTRFLANIF